MRVWHWIAGILAAVGIIVLIATGSDDRTFAGRDREAIEERSAQAMLAVPAGAGAEASLSVVTANKVAPPDVKSSLEDVQRLLATAATQQPDQAKATLEQAQAALKDAIDSTRDAAADTSNDVTRIRLLTLAHILERIEFQIQLRLDGM